LVTSLACIAHGQTNHAVLLEVGYVNNVPIEKYVRHVMFGMFAERILLVAVGVVTGWGVGLGLSKWVLGYLAITPTGDSVVPPMRPVWSTGFLLAVIGGILGATLMSLALCNIQIALHRAAPALRLEG